MDSKAPDAELTDVSAVEAARLLKIVIAHLDSAGLEMAAIHAQTALDLLSVDPAHC